MHTYIYLLLPILYLLLLLLLLTVIAAPTLGWSRSVVIGLGARLFLPRSLSFASLLFSPALLLFSYCCEDASCITWCLFARCCRTRDPFCGRLHRARRTSAWATVVSNKLPSLYLSFLQRRPTRRTHRWASKMWGEQVIATPIPVWWWQKWLVTISIEKQPRSTRITIAKK